MKLSLLPLAAIACSLALTGCALSGSMPSFSTTASVTHAAAPPAPAASVTAQLRALGAAHAQPRIREERDVATDQTRISLTTHRGTYFLWVEHPRITFFYVFAGRALEVAPPSVFLVFRTHEPQAPSSNHLTLSCNQVDEPQATVPTFAFEPGVQTTGRAFTYELPLATFAQFAGCNAAALRVGDIVVPFSDRQLADLRAFAGGMAGVP